MEATEDWKNKVSVQSVSANKVTTAQIERADLIVIQSDPTANKMNSTDGRILSMLSLYNKYALQGTADTFVDASGNVLDPDDTQNTFISYDSFIKYGGQDPAYSMDIRWDCVEKIVERAFVQNKATIVSAGDRNFNYVDGNMDKLIFMLAFMSKESYSKWINTGTPENENWAEYGLKSYISSQGEGDSKTGVIKIGDNKWDVWNETNIIEALFNANKLIDKNALSWTWFGTGGLSILLETG